MSASVHRMQEYKEKGEISIAVFSQHSDATFSSEIKKYLAEKGYSVQVVDYVDENVLGIINNSDGFIVMFSNKSLESYEFGFYSSLIAAEVEESKNKKFIISVNLGNESKLPSFFRQYSIIGVHGRDNFEKKIFSIVEEVDELVKNIKNSSYSSYLKKIKNTDADIEAKIRLENENLKRAILEYELSRRKKVAENKRLFLISCFLVIALSALFTNIFLGSDLEKIVKNSTAVSDAYSGVIVALLTGFMFGVLITTIVAYNIIKTKKIR